MRAPPAPPPRAGTPPSRRKPGPWPLGAALARAGLRRGAVFLRGELGAGKTTLVRGFLRELGIGGTIRSPTYTLVEEYRAGGTDVRHYDLYRLGGPAELEYLGLRDHLLAGALCFFEWPERGAGALPEPVLEVHLAHGLDGATALPSTGRNVSCVGHDAEGRRLVDRLGLDLSLASSL